MGWTGPEPHMVMCDGVIDSVLNAIFAKIFFFQENNMYESHGGGVRWLFYGMHFSIPNIHTFTVYKSGYRGD